MSGWEECGAGLAGLVDVSSRPQSCPHRGARRSRRRSWRVRREHPGWGPRTLAHRLDRAGIAPVLNKTHTGGTFVSHQHMPLLAMHGSADPDDRTCDGAGRLLNASTGPKWFITLEGALDSPQYEDPPSPHDELVIERDDVVPRRDAPRRAPARPRSCSRTRRRPTFAHIKSTR